MLSTNKIKFNFCVFKNLLEIEDCFDEKLKFK